MSELNNDIKVIVIGKSGAGKTSFVNKWTKNLFTDAYKATIVSEYGFKIYEHEGKYYRIQLWDIAGQDHNAKITKTFAKNAHGVIIMCDATNINSREETLHWKKTVDETEKFLDGSDLPCILVENKADLLDPNKANDLRELKKFSDDNGFITCFRTSAKTGSNLNETMSYLINHILEKIKNLSSKDMTTDRKTLTLEPEKQENNDDIRKQQKSRCC